MKIKVKFFSLIFNKNFKEDPMWKLLTPSPLGSQAVSGSEKGSSWPARGMLWLPRHWQMGFSQAHDGSSSRFCRKISGFTKADGDKLILWPCFGGNCLICSSFVKRCKTGGAPWKRDPPQSTGVGAPLGQEVAAVAHPCPCWVLAQKVNTLTISQTYCFKLKWTVVFST